MNILVLGSGGREHAFAWKIAQSKQCNNLYVAPGNAGTGSVATNLAVNIKDFDAVAEAVQTHNIDLLVVGPEEPLVLGIRNYFEDREAFRELLIVGPGEEGARLEGSKDFSKQFMQQHGIPTAASQTFTAESLEAGKTFLKTMKPPYVLKADGLAAGKGVVITKDLAEAEGLLEEMLVSAKFGAASSKVVIEEYLDGIELSVFVLSDGDSYKILPEAKDYKRIGEGDTGPNTGGMGAVSPVPFASESFMQKVENLVVKPTVNGLKADGISYRGFIFIGLMNVEGQPYVIEYNVRMGDPETEVVLPRIKSDLVDLLVATANGTLNKTDYGTETGFTTTVVGVSAGYPGSYAKGKLISGLDSAKSATVFHAGTKRTENGVETSGGRVVACTASGESLEEALQGSYQALAEIQWEGMNFRRDIGKDLENYL